MKRFVLIALLALISTANADDDNWQGYGDTALILTFKADSLKYSKWFKLSAYENLRIDVFANDTNSAGLSSDSIKFVWGIETAHYGFNTTRTSNPTYVRDYMNQLVIDTFDILTAANMAQARPTLGTDGTITMAFKKIDTLTFSGYAVQTREFAAPWDQHFRVWFKGLTGNRVGGWIKVVAQVARRSAVKTR